MYNKMRIQKQDNASVRGDSMHYVFNKTAKLPLVVIWLFYLDERGGRDEKAIITHNVGYLLFTILLGASV
jgi:hypothetical protein